MYDNICMYIHDELDELERKLKSGGKLTAAELEYGDRLAHFKKSLLTNSAMEDAGGEYSSRMDGDAAYYPRMGGTYRASYERGRTNAPRGRDGRYTASRYSREGGRDIADELRELMDAAPESLRADMQRLAEKAERM